MIPRPLASSFETVLTTAKTVAGEGDAWDDLLARVAGPHPHFSRQAFAAHRVCGLATDDLRLLTLRDGGRLAAVLPFALRRDTSALGGHAARPFLSPFVTATPPLVANEAVLDALVAGLALASGGRGWRWPLLPLDTPGLGLLHAMRRAGWQVGIAGSFERPVLLRRASQEVFLSQHPHKSRLKDLRRRERRLSELGVVAYETTTEGKALSSAVEDFLALERSGWKGAAGTALACRPETGAFARTLFSGGPGPVRPRADILRLDGRAIAISLALISGGTATLLKTAYDEAHRAHAPGLLLEAEIVRRLHATGFAEKLDSASLPGSPLENLYLDRETVGEIVALPPGCVGPSLDTRLRLVRFEAKARAEAKRLLRHA